jgi:hypothetical protein
LRLKLVLRPANIKKPPSLSLLNAYYLVAL